MINMKFKSIDEYILNQIQMLQDTVISKEVEIKELKNKLEDSLISNEEDKDNRIVEAFTLNVSLDPIYKFNVSDSRYDYERAIKSTLTEDLGYTLDDWKKAIEDDKMLMELNSKATKSSWGAERLMRLEVSEWNSYLFNFGESQHIIYGSGKNIYLGNVYNGDDFSSNDGFCLEKNKDKIFEHMKEVLRKSIPAAIEEVEKELKEKEKEND